MAPAPTEIPAEMFLVPDLGMPGGHSGRPLGPCLGRYESQTSHCRGQSSALSMGTFWVAIWDVYTWHFWVYAGTTKLQSLTSRFGLLGSTLSFWLYIVDDDMQLSLFSPDIFGLFLVTIWYYFGRVAWVLGRIS